MSARPLDPDERALWARVIATVRPIEARGPVVEERPSEVKRAVVKRTAPVELPPKPKLPVPAKADATLDGSWDKRLARGIVTPDISVDLHGHTLQSAYATLDGGLEHAIRSGARVMLLVTGKPPRERPEGGPMRGAIRAAVGDWLAASRHADHIAAVRNAHPRHGGAGALYIILRRRRG